MVEKRGPIWLAGMMGAGKSSVGSALARALGVDFIDTDAEIERRFGRRVSEIFEREGEAAFREAEAEVVESLRGHSGVVALGGGSLMRAGTAERLLAAGPVVYLRARPETLLARIGNPASRPLLAELDRDGRLAHIAELLTERESSYACASIIVDTDDTSLKDVVTRICAELDA